MIILKWFKNAFHFVAGRKIGKQRIFPITTKIVLVYILFILLSNFSSHYISLKLYSGEMVKLMRQLLARDLKEIYTFANTQYELYSVRQNRGEAFNQIEQRAVLDFKHGKSLMLGIKRDGGIGMMASGIGKTDAFTDTEVLREMTENLGREANEGFISFSLGGEKYFGVYKFNTNWDMFLIRAEEFSEFNEDSNRIFKKISVMILLITIACALVGVFIIDYILRFIRNITESIMAMIQKNSIELIDMQGSQPDDVTFMGMAFNSLSDTINRMMNIFQKFTNRDIVLKAYAEKTVRLEGSKRELTCLFSDIKSFTNMTEVLGTDIINLLNLHYTRVINIILKHEGIIGSIIGDALLVVYGVFGENSARVKSYQAVLTGYKIHEVTAEIRAEMEAVYEKIIAENGKLTAQEERVFRALLIEVGVGIDGGDVFYGNIGSYERMTNTVIGDTVNSSSRLEGLNRVYQAPVICSEYIKNDIIENVPDHGLEFLELDMVRVKGKAEGKRIYWPVIKSDITPAMRREMGNYSAGLKLYYKGEWNKARSFFKDCSLPPAEVLLHRTKDGISPGNWNGIWTMDSK
ncbi:MAG TPA: adenylate/guanylate cyclase domain-containing protein [Spirochaetota bacterium]|nr:adenylate/guanylate cyclase domain-containing protein [Spirochaetota bacterium]